MSPEDALEQVKRLFIFDNYIVGDMGQWLSVGKTVQKYLSTGDKVFDLGWTPRTTISDEEFAKIYGLTSSKYLYRDDDE